MCSSDIPLSPSSSEASLRMSSRTEVVLVMTLIWGIDDSVEGESCKDKDRSVRETDFRGKMGKCVT